MLVDEKFHLKKFHISSNLFDEAFKAKKNYKSLLKFFNIC